MRGLALIRLATYALIALAFFWPKPKRHVIPANLASPPEEESIDRMFDRFYRKRQEVEDIARKPGFEITKRSGSEVLRLAAELARKGGDDLTAYRPPTITLIRREDKMKWVVNWELKGAPIGGGFFSVLVDDESGATTLFPGI